MEPEITQELDRSEQLLDAFKGRTLDVITVHSPSAADAPFLGRNISKLSPIVSNLIESQIIRDLAETPGDHGYTWQRQDPGFPDAGLFDPSGVFTGHGFEVKAWYVLATEVTARFKEAQNLLEGRDVRVVLVPWMMSKVVYGQPVILDVCVLDAMSLAQARDVVYHRPPDYLVVMPEDTTERTANLQQSNVLGYKLQRERVAEADYDAMVRLAAKYDAPPIPHHDDTRDLNKLLMGQLPYRQESNFAKLWRTRHAGMREFVNAVMAEEVEGRSPAGWQAVINGLTSEDETVRETSEKAILEIYDED